MARNRSIKAKRAPAPGNTVELREQIQSGRTPSRTSAREPAAAPFDTDDEAAGRPAPRAAIEQAAAHENALAQHAARSPGAVGPVGKTVLIIALFALVSLLAIWVMLVV